MEHEAIFDYFGRIGGEQPISGGLGTEIEVLFHDAELRGYEFDSVDLDG